MSNYMPIIFRTNELFRSFVFIFNMKNLFFLAALLVLTAGCIRTNHTKKYTIYTPVYATKQEVRDAVKLNNAKAFKDLGSFVTYGNLVLINERDKGVHIIDNSASNSAQNKGFIPIPGNMGIAVKNNILFADSYADLFSIDISDINNVKLVKVSENIFTSRVNPYGINTNGNIIVDWIEKDTMVSDDFINRQTGFMLFESSFSNSSSGNAGGGQSTSSSMATFTISGEHLYAVDVVKLYTFNISTPTSPTLQSSLNVNWGVETIFPLNNKLFIGTRTGMFIYSISNPSSPVYESQFNHANVCDPVIADNNTAYVTLRSGNTCNGFTNQLDVIDISNIKNPQLIKTYPFTNPHGLSKYDNMLFICDGDDGLKLLDATNKNDIKHISNLKLGKCIDVIASNQSVIVITTDRIYFLKFNTNYELVESHYLTK